MKYCVWNNKGGVGKTFLTYCLAVEYAISNPDKIVVVADMCPQANISEMLLGGNGDGENNLNECYDNNRTIANYIKNRYDNSRFGKLGNEIGYFVEVWRYNKNMPKNLYLLPGDMDLDICSSIIAYLTQAPEKNAWQKTMGMFQDLTESFVREHKDKNVYFFVDLNPSFANYTQMGILGADRLIVPCTADSASMRGITNILRLIYGVRFGDAFTEESIFDEFHSKVRDMGLKLPKIHNFILNKSRTTNKDATAGYRAHVGAIEDIVARITQEQEGLLSDTCMSNRILNLKDGNNLALVLNHKGLPPSSLRHQHYEIYGQDSQVNASQIQPFMDNVRDLIAIL